MNEIREIHTYEDTTSTSTALIGFLVIALLVIIGIAMAVWQPWAAATPPSSNTTIIDRSAPAVNPPSNTTIINPPADSGGDQTNIDINTDKTGDTGSTGTTGSENGLGGGG